MAGIIKSKPKMLPMVGGVVNGIVSKKRICLEFHNSMRDAKKKKINKFGGNNAIVNTSNHGNICELWPEIRANTYITKYTFANYYKKKNEATSVLIKGSK